MPANSPEYNRCNVSRSRSTTLAVETPPPAARGIGSSSRVSKRAGFPHDCPVSRCVGWDQSPIGRNMNGAYPFQVPPRESPPPTSIHNSNFVMVPTEKPWVVCIVDDDDAVRKGLSRLMRASGFEVRTYATSESFLQAASPENHACVLMDITMPRMSGLQLQQRLKEKGIDLPVIAISGRDDDDARHMARSLGARFLLSKPVDDRALLDAIAWITGAKG